MTTTRLYFVNKPSLLRRSNVQERRRRDGREGLVQRRLLRLSVRDDEVGEEIQIVGDGMGERTRRGVA